MAGDALLMAGDWKLEQINGSRAVEATGGLNISTGGPPSARAEAQ
jgi:hypothetical protein